MAEAAAEGAGASAPGARRDPPILGVIAAFAAIYIIWGSTYLGIRIAVETLPPLLMAGVRFLLAGAGLYAWMRWRGAPRPLAREWGSAALVGCLMLVGGNGLVCVAEQTVPSGLTALLIATVPLWLALFDWFFFRGPRPTALMVAGLLAGLLGIYILLDPGTLGGARVDLLGAAQVLVACVFWSIGSLAMRRVRLPRSVFISTAMQMLTAGCALVLVGLARGEAGQVALGAISARSLVAFAYLVVFGSIVALTSYGWLIQVSTPARVGTYAYVNPIIAVLLGAAVAKEPLTARVGVAAAIILGAVAMISLRRTPR